MHKITGSPGHRTRHRTVTEQAAKVYDVLRKAGFVAYPGFIRLSGGSGGGLRLRVASEPSRTCITVHSGGSQELLLYGPVDLSQLLRTLRSLNPQRLTTRAHPHSARDGRAGVNVS